MARRLPASPRRPEGATVTFPDGRTLPLEVKYVGVHDGVHVWQNTVPLDEPPESVSVSVLPGRSSISLVCKTRVEQRGTPDSSG